MSIETVVIAGAGPAGLTAAIYAARAQARRLAVPGETQFYSRGMSKAYGFAQIFHGMQI